MNYSFLSSPTLENFFWKKMKKNRFFSKTHRQIVFGKKCHFFSKTHQQIVFFHVPKIKIDMVGPIVFYKKSQIFHFFFPFTFRKQILKILIFQKKMIIFPLNYEKKLNFCQIFQKKIDFFFIFCQILHILGKKLQLNECDTYFTLKNSHFFWSKKIKFEFKCGGISYFFDEFVVFCHRSFWFWKKKSSQTLQNPLQTILHRASIN